VLGLPIQFASTPQRHVNGENPRPTSAHMKHSRSAMREALPRWVLPLP
jgi:hypothetical protein